MTAFDDFLRAVEQATGKQGRRQGGEIRLLCPAHDDHDPSLDVKEGDDGRPLVQCRSHGCTFEAICEALGREPRDFLPVTAEGEWTPRGTAVAVYRYTDAEGRLLFEVCRTADKQFPQRRPDPAAKSGWRWNLTGVDRVLYQLPAVLRAAAAGELVYVVEGEKDVAALERAGAVATCNPGGAGKWRAHYSDALRGARAVVVADNDDAGIAHARKVVASLRRAGITVERIVRAREGKDAADHLAAGKTLEELEEFELPAETKEPARDEAREKEPPQATALVRLACDRYVFGHTAGGETFALPKTGPRVARILRGKGSLRTELAAAHLGKTKQAASAAALADALLTIEGLALLGDELELSLRVARQGSELVLDLGRKDGAAIILGAGGWRCVESAPAPVTFRRTALTSGLPTPIPGGSLDELRELVNVSDRDWPLLVGWLVAALLADIAHPILFLSGVQGAAKSTAARLLCSVLDASPAPLRAPPRDPNDWAVAASASWIVPLDNISKIPEWLADAMCRAVTGDGLVRRALFTDDELSVLSFRRVLAITAIDAGALRGDLADRLLPVELERIPPERRRTDDDIAAHFQEAHPRILGALLDLAVRVIEARPGVELDGLPRMADAARIFAALDQVDGTQALPTYLELGEQLAAEVVDDDDVARVVRSYVGEHGSLEGTAAECLDRLTPESAPKGWPTSPRALAGRFRRIAPALREVGIEISWERVGRDRARRCVYYVRREGEGQQPTPPTPPSLLALTDGLSGVDSGVGGVGWDGRAAQPSPDFPLNQADAVGGVGGDGAGPAFSDERDPSGNRQRVRDLHAQGLDVAAIAAEVGRSERFVTDVLAKDGA